MSIGRHSGSRKASLPIWQSRWRRWVAGFGYRVEGNNDDADENGNGNGKQVDGTSEKGDY